MPDQVRDACEARFDANKNDCCGFVRAVAASLGIPLHRLANDIVDTLRNDNAWTKLSDGVAASRSAAAGYLVIAGLKLSEQAQPNQHGHVVVVVDGPLARGAYPSAYWGSLARQPRRIVKAADGPPLRCRA